MATKVIPAIYENGILRPLVSLDLSDKQKVYLTVKTESEQTGVASLAAWQSIYTGLSEEDIDEVEAISLRRDNFMRQDAEE